MSIIFIIALSKVKEFITIRRTKNLAIILVEYDHIFKLKLYKGLKKD